MAEFRAVALDFDGTIADSPRVHRLARQQAYDALAQADERFLDTPQRDALFTIAHRLGATSLEVEAQVLVGLGIVPCNIDPHNDAKVVEVAGIKGEIYQGIAAKGLPSIPGALDFVKDFADKFGPRSVAVVTTASNAEVTPFLNLHELSDSVGYVITRDYRGGVAPDRLKPHPYQYEQALRLLCMAGIAAREVVSVEDSHCGILAAKAAGLYVAGIATTHDPRDLFGADIIFNDFVQLRGTVLPVTVNAC